MSVMEKYHNTWLKELFGYLAIPSISTDINYKDGINKAAKYVQSLFLEAGCVNTELIFGYGNPVVYGEYIHDASKPTILVYGHYDIQPPGDINLWCKDPFSPCVKSTPIHPDGAIFARGASDQKGQLFIHIKALGYLLKKEKLNYNIKFIIEGEEEIGSVNLHRFVKEYRELLKADIILISDTAFIDENVPTITTSLRGFTGVEVFLKTTEDDLHSGLFGGALVNPVYELCRLIGKLKNEDLSINIDGFYDDVIVFDKKARELLNRFPIRTNKKEERFLEGEKGYTPMEHSSIRPSIDMHGIKGGFIQEGIKTIIPNNASAKISLRLVANQKAQNIQTKLIKYFDDNISKTVSLQISPLPCAEPYIINSNNEWLIKAKQAMQNVYKKEVFEFRSGGSLPIISTFEKELGCKTILIGFGLNSDNIHGINEHFGLNNLFKGIDTMIEFYKEK